VVTAQQPDGLRDTAHYAIVKNSAFAVLYLCGGILLLVAGAPLAAGIAISPSSSSSQALALASSIGTMLVKYGGVSFPWLRAARHLVNIADIKQQSRTREECEANLASMREAVLQKKLEIAHADPWDTDRKMRLEAEIDALVEKEKEASELRESATKSIRKLAYVSFGLSKEGASG